MTTGSTGTKRRTFFQRGLALLAGGAALAGTSRLAGADPGPASPPAAPGSTLTLFARSRPVAPHQHGADSRVLATGDLLDGPDGERIGTFYTNCFCAPAPFGGVQTAAPSTLEFHVLQLKDGTLFSILGFSHLSGVTVTGAKWPLDGVEVPFGSSLTMSNEVRGGLRISFAVGRALLVAHPYPAEGAAARTT